MSHGIGLNEIGGSKFDPRPLTPPASSSSVQSAIAEKVIGECIIGKSPVIRRLREKIAVVGPLDRPVLIEGPTGAGKELVARALHDVSRRPGRFVAFNVCAIPEALFEATLFGYNKGAYTGATSPGSGHLTDANDGTAFADEIGGLPLLLQPKLLRAVELREYQPLGSGMTQRSNFRLVTATNVDLFSLVETGHFRHDLAERLRAFTIDVPPLAARREDIPMLVRHFASLTAAQMMGRETEFDADAIGVLMAYHWPRNVRELRNVVERACAFARSSVVGADEVIEALGRPGTRSSQSAVESRDEEERREIFAVLSEVAWDTAQAATRLGVHRSTVYRAMRRLGIPGQRAR